MRYFVVCSNGVSFGFDSAARSPRLENILFFECIVSDSLELVCQLDLHVSKLVFDFKSERTDTVYFKIVPVGGAK